jgi:hypothetical protein
VPRLHGAPGGPTPITGTARIAPAIFYIVLTQLSGHTQVEVARARLRLPSAAWGAALGTVILRLGPVISSTVPFTLGAGSGAPFAAFHFAAAT